MIAIVLTIVLFLAKSDPMTITKAFDDPYACGDFENVLLTKAMKEQAVVGYAIVNNCKRVQGDNKV